MLGRCFEIQRYRACELLDIIRGESSHYIVPGRVPMCDRKVLYAMRCMCYMLLCDMYVLCMLRMIWTGRSGGYGPEGQYG